MCVWGGGGGGGKVLGIYIVSPLFLYLKNILERNFSTMCLRLLPVLISLYKHRAASQKQKSSQKTEPNRPRSLGEASASFLLHVRKKGDHTAIEHFQ